jgi:hypothetical protein
LPSLHQAPGLITSTTKTKQQQFKKTEMKPLREKKKTPKTRNLFLNALNIPKSES